MLLFECLHNQFYVILYVILIVLFGVELDVCVWGGGGNRNGSGYTHGPQNICMSSDPDDHNQTRIDQSRPASKVSI